METDFGLKNYPKQIIIMLIRRTMDFMFFFWVFFSFKLFTCYRESRESSPKRRFKANVGSLKNKNKEYSERINEVNS